MPYIPYNRRQALWDANRPETAGELNYQLTTIVLNYLGDSYNYERLNAAIGALEACKLELYRRMIAPYENNAIKRNGDVYPIMVNLNE